MTRMEAVNWLNNIMSDIGKSQHRELWHYEQALAEIRELLEEDSHWIPCSERMPDEFGEYLVTKKAIGWNCDEYNSNDIAYFDNEGFHKADKVLAWMPLPKPYGGESDE